jgi:pantoate--beta-alanine ligase
MRTVAAIGEVRAVLRESRAGRSVGLVPTMGALHAGHVALISAARNECDIVVLSSFVNPTQFGPGEDLASYPRDANRDAQVASEAVVDIFFAPTPDELYPAGFQTWVDVEELGRVLEGRMRPGHFRGVATVCLKLFNIVRPDRAYFGEKDAQQVAVVRRMVADLDLELEIRTIPTVRDTDGVALSSRNAYLSPDERQAAAALPRALKAGADAHRARAHADAVARTILAGAPGVQTEYVDVISLNGHPTLVAAVRVGSTRLIDNVRLDVASPSTGVS